ncbi:fimbrial biogenesis outer membrane usher protein CupB3 [Dyella jejuensis]
MGEQVDLSRFEKGNVVLPGSYRVDITVNDQWQGRDDVTFSAVEGQDSAVPCFDATQLSKLGINLDKVARGDGSTPADVAAHALPHGPICGDLGKYIPDASVAFDSTTQSLTLSVPQLYMNNAARGYVDPSQWDNGINAGMLAYNFSSSHTTGPASSTQSYLGINAGINLGAWHLRHQGSLSNVSGRYSSTNYQNTATYLQRDIPAWGAQVVVGDSFTSGQVADSFRLRGVSLFTDDRMNPQSQQGYAPTIHGNADSNARVTVRQNGYIIYETTVAAGPFEINDLFPTGYGGDLEVTVTEADGRKNIFTVPFTALPQLLRPGTTHFSVAAGQLQQYGTYGSTPWVMQATLQHGFNNTLTGFGSVTSSQGYGQMNLGTAISTRFGAVSFNVAASHTQLPGPGLLTGQSVGVAFNKNFTDSGTNFALGAYRFSTNGYLDVQDAVALRDLVRYDGNTNQVARQRSRLNLNISQKIGGGQLYFNGSTVDYWGSSTGRQTSYSIGYGNSYKSLTYGISAQRTRLQAVNRTPTQVEAERIDDIFYGPGAVIPGRTDNRIMLSFSMPLGSSPRAPNFRTYASRDTGASAGTSLQAGISGVAGDSRNINYEVSGNRTNGNAGSTYFNGNVGYQGSFANLRAGYSHSNNANQIAVGASGGVIVHGGGVSFAQSLGDTVGLVEAPGASGARVGSAVGVKVDGGGYAVVPYLTPYQLNTIGLNPKDMSSDVELKSTTQSVAPHLGAVVKLKYETETGRAVIIRAARADGKPLPFAAEVFDAGGKSVGVVGQAGKLFVRGIADSGTLTVKWGSTQAGQCRIDYRLPAQRKGQRQVFADVIEGQCVSTLATSAAEATSHAAGAHTGQDSASVDRRPNGDRRDAGIKLPASMHASVLQRYVGLRDATGQIPAWPESTSENSRYVTS